MTGLEWLKANLDYDGDECLIWYLFRDTTGYGRIGIKGKIRWAHRVMCELVHGPAPEGHHRGEYVRGDTEAQVFFYEQDFYVLSNFSAFRLMWRGRDFDTSEAAYHWERFATGQEGNRSPAFGSIAARIADDIRFAPSAHAAFKIAQEHKSSQRPDWESVKVGVMRDILRAKASQHEYVRRKLLATGDRELIEDSWRDDFWGWGPDRIGQNMLGKLWMEIRHELRTAEAA